MDTAGRRDARVLVVEDDRDIRESLRDVLEDAGYRVVLAAHGREALDRLDELHKAGTLPRVILLDLMMPVMSGAELLEAMGRDKRYATIPVIIVSAWPQEAAATEPKQGFVKKPIDLDELLRTLNRFC